MSTIIKKIQKMEEARAASNALFAIKPYWHDGTWVFDDPGVNLFAEPFVAGIPEMIDVLVEHIPNAKDGFLMIFSGTMFATRDPIAKIEKVADEMGGAWYRGRLDGKRMHGWLCPALMKYFPEPPEEIWVSASEIVE